MKKRSLAVILFALVLLLVLPVMATTSEPMPAAADAPVLDVAAKNLSLNNTIDLVFYVTIENGNANNVRLMTWSSAQNDYAYGTQEKILEPTTIVTYKQKPCAIFYYTGLAAKQMADDIYVRAFVDNNGTKTFSGVDKYSILQYAFNKINATSPEQKLLPLLNGMLDYGAQAQTYFGYNVNRLANADFYRVKVVGGLLADQTDRGLYLPGSTVTLIAPAQNAAGEPFYRWTDANGNVLSYSATYTYTVGTENADITATYGGIYTVSVVNGTLASGQTTEELRHGTSITLTAGQAANGYAFSHWENAAGQTVGTDRVLTLTVSQSDTYKAYYKAEFGSNTIETVILTNLQTEWQQGGINGGFTSFDVGASATKHRVSFAEPFLLKAGESLTVSVPKDPWTCPYATDNRDDTVPCNGGCTVAVAKLILKKNPGSSTGNLLTDYTLVEKATWAMGGFRYEATSDVYVMITVKYDKHGATTFNVNKPIMQELTVTHSVPTESPENEILLGSYWKAELTDAAERIEANRKAIGGSVSEFFFLTDVHWKDYNAQYSPALINYLADKLNAYFMVFGGDIIELNATKDGAINEEIKPFYAALTDYTKAGEQLKILSTVGNHDRNFLAANSDKSTILTDAEVYELYVARTEGWAVTSQDNPYCSYYDDTENKVRYLQFAYASNTVDLASSNFEHALQWCEQQITSLNSDWTIVLISHGIFGGTQNEILDAVKDRVLSWQAKADAEIAIWITGHTHSDNNEIFVSKDGKTAVRAISLNGDSYGKMTASSFAMTYNTVTEQSFSFLQIDKKNERIYLTRIGAGTDLTFTYGSAMEGEYDAVPQYAVRVVNGSINSKNYIRCAEGTVITLVADNAPAGYRFSCWKDYDGNVISYSKTFNLTVTESNQYKPYYVDIDPSNDNTNPNRVMTDVANDWMQGGLSTLPVDWWLDGTTSETRVCFVEPILLKKGQTITVTFPTIECPTGGCSGGCKLTSLIAAMDKTAETPTHDLPSEYTVYHSKWSTSYTATKDTYVMVLVKYDKHGNLNFSTSNEYMPDVVITVR